MSDYTTSNRKFGTRSREPTTFGSRNASFKTEVKTAKGTRLASLGFDLHQFNLQYLLHSLSLTDKSVAMKTGCKPQKTADNSTTLLIDFKLFHFHRVLADQHDGPIILFAL
jgi:hypothetical protein